MHMFHFTTVVSGEYLFKFLAMQESLDKYCSNYHLFALCVDAGAYEALRRIPLKNITILNLQDLEDNQLLIAKKNRSYLEYCWTLKPFILNYIVTKYKDAQYFAHLDADLFFFSSPEAIFNEAPDAALFLTDHNNSEKFIYTYETSGRFNTGFVGCKNNETTVAAIDWWKTRCLEKCVSTANVQEKLFGDQRYVEIWLQLFDNVHVVKTKGANAAQWNIEGYDVYENNGQIFVNQDKLIFYHFSGLSILSENEFNLTYFYPVQPNPLQYIYIPYIKELSKCIRLVKGHFSGFNQGYIDRRIIPIKHYVKI